jgi:hypothetical protein
MVRKDKRPHRTSRLDPSLADESETESPTLRRRPSTLELAAVDVCLLLRFVATETSVDCRLRTNLGAFACERKDVEEELEGEGFDVGGSRTGRLVDRRGSLIGSGGSARKQVRFDHGEGEEGVLLNDLAQLEIFRAFEGRVTENQRRRRWGIATRSNEVGEEVGGFGCDRDAGISFRRDGRKRSEVAKGGGEEFDDGRVRLLVESSAVSGLAVVEEGTAEELNRLDETKTGSELSDGSLVLLDHCTGSFSGDVLELDRRLALARPERWRTPRTSPHRAP